MWSASKSRAAFTFCLTIVSGALLAPFVTAQSPSSARHPRDPAALFRTGQQALADNQLAQAESAFRDVLKLDPKSAAAHANLGVVAMRRKDWEAALAELRKAEKLDPKMSGVRLNIGLVEYRRANYAAAITPFQSVLKVQPDSTQPRYLLGLCLLFIERYADAATTLEPLWPKMSDQFVYLYALSNAAFHAKNESLDQKALQRLIEIGGDSPEFHLVMAKAMLARHESQRALDELAKAEAGNPNLPFLHFNRGLAYRQTNQLDLAEESFRKDTETEPDSPYGFEQLGKLYLREQREDEAQKVFQEALRREARLPDTLIELAKIEMHHGDLNPALQKLDAALKLTPKSQSAHFVRGQVLQKLGRKGEANSEFAAARNLLAAGIDRDRAVFQTDPIPDPQLANQP